MLVLVVSEEAEALDVEATLELAVSLLLSTYHRSLRRAISTSVQASEAVQAPE